MLVDLELDLPSSPGSLQCQASWTLLDKRKSYTQSLTMNIPRPTRLSRQVSDYGWVKMEETEEAKKEKDDCYMCLLCLYQLVIDAMCYSLLWYVSSAQSLNCWRCRKLLCSKSVFGLCKLTTCDERSWKWEPTATTTPSTWCPSSDIGEASQWTSPPPTNDHVPQRGSHSLLLQCGHQLSPVIASVGWVPAPPPPLWGPCAEDPSAGTDASYAGKQHRW